MRGVAAIAVAIGHYGMLVPCIFYYRSVYLPVDFFFCLSGFVIAHAYEQRLRSGLSAWRFMALRIIRLYPFYLLGLAVGIVQWAAYRALWSDPLTHAVTISQFLLALGASLVYVPSIPLASVAKTIQFPFNPPAWSLCFELLINLFFALVARRLSRLLLTALIVAFGLLLMTAVHVTGTLNGGLEWFGLVGIARAGYSFFMGVLLRRIWKPERSFSLSYLWLIAIFLIVISVPLHGGAKACYDLAVVMAVFPALIFVAASIRDGNAQINVTGRCIGSASYGLYAIHFPAIWLFATLFPRFYGHHDYFPSILIGAAYVGLLILYGHAARDGFRQAAAAPDDGAAVSRADIRTTTDETTSSTRFDGLDALRAVAAITVAWTHLQVYGPFHGTTLFPGGFLEVDFFFCLSGFVIAHTYDQRLAAGLSPLAFIKARCIRFYPFYLFGTLLGAWIWFAHVPLIGGSVSSDPSILRTTLLLNALFIPVPLPYLSPWQLGFAFDFPAWTLFFELVVNFCYAWCFPKITKSRLLIAMTVFAGLLVWVACNDRTLSAGLAYGGLPGLARTGFSFCTGALLRRLWNPSQRSNFSFGALACMLVVIAAVPLVGTFQLIYDLMIVLFVFPAMVMAGAMLATGRRSGGPPMRLLGASSYGFYAIHHPAIFLLATFFVFHSPHHPSKVLLLVEGILVLTIIYAAAIAFQRYLDRPIRRYLTKILGQSANSV